MHNHKYINTHIYISNYKNIISINRINLSYILKLSFPTIFFPISRLLYSLTQYSIKPRNLEQKSFLEKVFDSFPPWRDVILSLPPRVRHGGCLHPFKRSIHEGSSTKGINTQTRDTLNPSRDLTPARSPPPPKLYTRAQPRRGAGGRSGARRGLVVTAAVSN